MKKLLKTGKKTLSVIMAVMMVLSAWVWVAPTEASAATAGNYYVEITWNVYDTKKYSNKFTGTETENGARAGLLLYYKTNNGTGTERKVYWDIGYEDQKGTAYGTFVDASTGAHTNSKTTHTTKCIINGFPTAFYATSDSDYFLDGGGYTVTKIVVGKPSSNSLSSASISNKKTLWEGTGKCETTTEWKWFKITADGTGANGKLTTTETGNDSKYGVATSSSENWQFPTPTTTTTYTGKVDNVTVPKSGTSDVMTVKVIANDQYGVQMGTPTWSVKGSVCGTTGISVSPTSGDSTTVKLTNAANVTTGDDTQTGTITATWGSAGSLSDNFIITDSYYTATFNYQVQNADNNTSSPKTETRSGYHDDSITAPTAPSYYDQDYLKTFKAWTPTYSSTITKDVTYTATYNDTFTEADYDIVDDAINEVKAAKESWGAEYDAKFSYASRMAVENAITEVVRGLGRTQQSRVDGFAEAILTALYALEPNKFDVIFLDKDGAILLYEKDVEYKQGVAAPTYNAKYYDTTNHYAFSGWDTDLSEYTYVTDDLVIQPVFAAEAHVFTTSTVESTCVQKGATKYTCSVCGYSYIDGETDFGDHKWAADYTIDIHPTCTQPGQKSIYCTVEGCNAQKDITVIPALGHQWGTVSSLAPATCERDGINTRLCDACGVCEHTIVSALGHSYGEPRKVPATCTSKGYDEYTCANCGHSYKDNFTEDVLKHSYPEIGEVIQEKACGVTEILKFTCDCGHIDIRNGETGAHDDADWVVVLADTCEYAGYRTKTCSKCTLIIDAEVIDTIQGHSYAAYAEGSSDATCTTAGVAAEKCSTCGDVKTTTVQPLGHDWDNGVETSATCTSGGYITFTCKRENCGETKIELINGSASLVHNFDDTIEENVKIDKYATCEIDGSKTVKCKNCEAKTTVVIPKLGHNYGDWVKTDATNDTDGSWYHKCQNANCGKEETLTIPKGGHKFEEDASKYVAPKCNAKGQRVYKCTAHENCIAKVVVELDYAQHDVKQRISKEATCTTEGEVEAYCSVCNKSFSKFATPVTAHNPVAGNYVAPTCTTAGYTPYACSCGISYKQYDGAEATGHTYTAKETTAPTCTTTGVMTYTCACGDSYTENIPVIAHTYTKTASTDATCSALGTETYTCACSDSYTVYVGTIDKTKHSWSEWTVEKNATNESDGYKTRTCSACGCKDIIIIAATGSHIFNVKDTEASKAPTCTEDGCDVLKCSAHTDCTATSTIPVSKLGHDVTAEYTAPTCISKGSSKAVCSRCGVLSEKNIPAISYHDFSGDGVITTPAGCTTDGVITYTCETVGCNVTKTQSIPAKGHTFKTTVEDAKCETAGTVTVECTACKNATTYYALGAKNHAWNNGEETKAPTCTEKGTKTYTCALCNGTKTEEIPAKGHTWSTWSVTPSKNNEPGSVSRYCTVNGCTATESIEIPAGGHNLVVDTENSTNASCTSTGTTVYKCETHTNCGITVSVTTEMLQHTYETLYKDASCIENGYLKTTCSVCKKVLVDKIIRVTAHTFDQGTSYSATCTEAGYVEYKCKNADCTYSYKAYAATDPAKGHTLVEGISTATCTDGGEMLLSCSKCTYTTKVKVPAKGHTYDEGTVVQVQSCTKAEKTEYKCACGESYIAITKEAKEHSFGDWTKVQEATTDSYGIDKRVCSACGTTEYKTTAPIGEHTFEKVEEEKATCTKEGYIKWECKTHDDCKANYTETLDKLPHVQTIKYDEPKCSEAGSTQIICEDCSAELSEAIVIPAKGHAYNTSSVTTEPGCTTKGVRTFTCSCGDSYTVEIPAKGHSYTTTVVDATCTTDGSVVTKCACGDTHVNKTLLMLGHSWNSGEETKAPTCTEKGTKTYTCSLCKTTKTEDIPANGHTWSTWSVTPSTNAGEGSVTRNCTVEGCKATETITIPAGGHNLVVDTVKSTNASCTSTGTLVYKCAKHTDCGITVSVTTERLQHELKTIYNEKATCTTEGKVITKCSKCETSTIITTIAATGHSYTGEVTTAATCTSTGTKTYTCAHNSEHTYTEELAMLQHVYGDESTTDATCTSSGYTTRKCNTCDSRYTVITAAAKGHDYKTQVKSTATCLNGGELTLKCDCGDTMTTKVPALGHNYELKGTTAATCAAAATKTYDCSRCEASYTISTTPATGNHNFVAKETVAATFDSLGYVIMECECGQKSIEILPALGDHVYDSETTDKLDETCTTDGYIVYACSVNHNCGLTSKVIIPATGHDFEETTEATAPGCESIGKTAINTCNNCGDTEGGEEIPALGHSYGDATVTAAKCNQAGKLEYPCTRCSHVKEVVIPADTEAHKLVVDVEPSTCGSEGKVIVTCANNCGYKDETSIPARQHSWGDWVKTDATNTTNGEWKRICNNNSAHTETVVIPMGGHKFDTKIIASKTDATCNVQGTATYNCTAHTDCGVTITVNTGFAEHTYATKVVESCTTNGSVKTYCSVCDPGCAKPFASIALGKAQHSYDDGVTTPATCTSSGYTLYTCAKCGKSYKEIGEDAKGHSLKEGDSTASCTAPGKMTLECENANCTYSTTADVPALGHNYVENTDKATTATCAAAATKTYDCSRCEASYTVSVGTKTEEHSWNEWTVVEKATYTSLGYQIRTCKVCGKLEVETISALGGEHAFDSLVSSTDPTCITAGEEIYACSASHNCGLTSAVTVPATGHSLTETSAATAPGCESVGYTAAYSCENCNYTEGGEEIPALGHTYGNGEVTPSTCNTEGSIVYKCACGDEYVVTLETNGNAHQYEVIVNDATCTAPGSVVRKCNLCQDETKIKDLPVIGHNWGTPVIVNADCENDGSKTYKCTATDCDATKTETIAKLGHNMVAGTPVAPTCTTSGYTPYTCANNCGHEYKVYNATVAEHNYVQVEGSSTATCTAPGEVTLECTLCHDTIITAVPALGHDWGDWSVAKNPTDGEEGLKTRSCKRTDCTAVDEVILPALGHTMVKDEAASKAPSCFAEGENVYYCTSHTACGYTYTEQLEKLPHTYGEGEVKQNASCTADGEKVYTCTANGCGAELTETILATGHTLETAVVEATCTTPGSVVTKCACGYTHETKTLETKPHTVVVSYAYPNCEEAGYVITTCNVCKNELSKSTTPAIGHNFDESVEGNVTPVEKATCAADGLNKVKCSRCSEVKDVTVPKLNHDYVAIKTVAATCTESGYVVMDCKNCDSAYNEFVSDPTGHKWNDGEITTPATCTANGVKTYTCTVTDCGETKTEVIGMLGHKWGPWTVTLNPTATVEGIQSRTCETCKSTENATIPALGGVTLHTVTFIVDGEVIATQKVTHNGKAEAPVVSKPSDDTYHYSYIWNADFSKVTSDLTVTAIFTPVTHIYGEWVIDVPAGCNNEGLRHRVCECGYVQYENVATTEHDFIIEVSKEPTCTENGYGKGTCSICGKTEDRTITRLGHVLTYHERVEPTCDTNGMVGHYSCSRCGKNYKERSGKTEITEIVIEKIYHTFLVVEGYEATCTKEGKTDYMFCTSCGLTKNPEPIPAFGHKDDNNDNTCDNCGSTYMQGGTVVCSCSCHKNGTFNAIIYKILSFFWRLFGINKSCECGYVHY